MVFDKIKVFSNPNCIKCKMTKSVLLRQGFDFEESSVFEAPGVMSNSLQTIVDGHSDLFGELKSAPVVAVFNGNDFVDGWSDFQIDKIKSLTQGIN